MKLKFEINTELYSENIINQAIKDFKDISNIEINNNNLSIEWDNEKEITEIFNEFINYVIWIYNELD